MTELIARGKIRATDILESCRQVEFPNGDLHFVSDHYADHVVPGYESQLSPFQLILSPKGRERLSQGKHLLELDDTEFNDRNFREEYQGLRSWVTKKNLGRFWRKDSVAVKIIKPFTLDMTGIEQFQSVRALEEMGIICASPLMATKWRYVSEWVEGKLGYDTDPQILNGYLEALKTISNLLKDQKRWNQDWKVEDQPANYVIADLNSPNILERFVAIDPTYIHSIMGWF